MSLQNLPFSYHFTLYSETKMEVFPKWLIFLSNMNKRKINLFIFLVYFAQMWRSLSFLQVTMWERNVRFDHFGALFLLYIMSK